MKVYHIGIISPCHIEVNGDCEVVAPQLVKLLTNDGDEFWVADAPSPRAYKRLDRVGFLVDDASERVWYYIEANFLFGVCAPICDRVLQRMFGCAPLSIWISEDDPR